MYCLMFGKSTWHIDVGQQSPLVEVVWGKGGEGKKMMWECLVGSEFSKNKEN